jgi:hypothetical protein
LYAIKREEVVKNSAVEFKFETHTVDIFDFQSLVEVKVFPQPGDKNIQAPTEEVVVFSPDALQDEGALHYLVQVFGEEFEEVCFFLCERLGIIAALQAQIFVIEGVMTDPDGDILLEYTGVPGSLEEDFDFEYQFFDTEGFGDIIIGTEGQSVNFILLHSLGCQEKNGHEGITFSYFFGEGEAVDAGQHNIQDAQVEVCIGLDDIQSLFTVGAVGDGITLVFQVIAGDKTEAFVVFDIQKVGGGCGHAVGFKDYKENEKPGL